MKSSAGVVCRFLPTFGMFWVAPQQIFGSFAQDPIIVNIWIIGSCIKFIILFELGSQDKWDLYLV